MHSIKGYFPSTYSVPSTVLGSEDTRLNLQKQFLHLEASWSRARKPLTLAICLLPSYTFPSKYLFSCVPPVLIHCIFTLSHSKYFPCDFFFDLHVFIVAFTHLFSAQPTLTEYLYAPGSGLGTASDLKQFVAQRSIHRLVGGDRQELDFFT